MPARLKHLMLVTVEDPYSVKSWSGTVFALREALARHVDRLTVFRPNRPSRNPIDVARRLRHYKDPLLYPLWMTKATLKKNAREVQAEIDRANPDAVLSISSQCVAFLAQPGKPVFLFSDAPWLAWQEAYTGSRTRPLRMAWFAEQEAHAAKRLDGLFFGSEWAVSEAMRLYAGGEKLRERLHVTPLGSNLLPDRPREEVLQILAARKKDEIELLYVGKDWERKGGPLAVEVAALLHATGQKVRLHIVGCTPDLAPETTAFVTIHGLLQQNNPEQKSTLIRLFERSHFFLVPTTAECFGVVFAEAQAFALPPISRAVRALPSVIVDNKTGMLMDLAAPAGDYVERILALWQNPSAYREMALAGRDRFEQVLNWDETAAAIVKHIDNSLTQQRSTQAPTLSHA
jgi:glycosyltransferase involved in cell wall biosynthesis